MLNWLLPIAALFMLYLIIQGLDRLQSTLDAFHEDYRKVNNLDTRQEMEMR